MQARDCAAIGGGCGPFPFGLDPKRTAEALRCLADEIESGRTLLEKIYTVDLGRGDEWGVQRVILTLHETINGE
jgi:hypothetical protein